MIFFIAASAVCSQRAWAEETRKTTSPMAELSTHLAAAIHAEPHTEDAPRRIAIAAVDASGPFAEAIEALEQQVGALYDLVNHGDYLRSAKALKIRFPLSSKAAWRLGHVLHATHTLIIKTGGLHRPASARVLLIDMKSGELLSSDLYFLTKTGLSRNDQKSFRARLKKSVALEKEMALPQSQHSEIKKEVTLVPALAVPIEYKERTSSEKTPPSKARSMPIATAADQEAQAEHRLGEAAKKTAALNFEYLELMVGISFAERRATLHPRLVRRGQAPCFCRGDGFSGAYPSALLGVHLRPFSILHRRLGARVQSELGYSAQPSSQIHTGDSAGGAAFRLDTTITLLAVDQKFLRLEPEIGYFYRLFNVSDGPFLALSRGGFQAAVRLGLKNQSASFGADLKVGLHLVTADGIESRRLGRRKGGSGYFLEFSPRYRTRLVFLGLGLRFEQASLFYSGATALFDPADLEDVHLSDTVLSGFVNAGFLL